MLVVIFLFSQISAIELTVSTKKVLYSIEDIESLKQTLNDILLPIIFAKFWKFKNSQFDHALD